MTCMLRRRRPSWSAPLMLLALVGCGSSADVNPSADLARASLERALATWKEGGPPGTIAGAEPTVEVVDSAWRNGQKIEGFEIIGEEKSETDKRFVVRLKQPKPAEDKEVTYVVLGRGPVWVYRDEDFVRSMNMDDNPTPPAARKKGRGR